MSGFSGLGPESPKLNNPLFVHPLFSHSPTPLPPTWSISARSMEHTTPRRATARSGRKRVPHRLFKSLLQPLLQTLLSPLQSLLHPASHLVHQRSQRRAHHPEARHRTQREEAHGVAQRVGRQVLQGCGEVEAYGGSVARWVGGCGISPGTAYLYGNPKPYLYMETQNPKP
jgi:hypothetical protein